MATCQEVEKAVNTRFRGKTLHADLITIEQAIMAHDEKIERLWEKRGSHPIGVVNEQSN